LLAADDRDNALRHLNGAGTRRSTSVHRRNLWQLQSRAMNLLL
jgi:hypothetical protein